MVYIKLHFTSAIDRTLYMEKTSAKNVMFQCVLVKNVQDLRPRPQNNLYHSGLTTVSQSRLFHRTFFLTYIGNQHYPGWENRELSRF